MQKPSIKIIESFVDSPEELFVSLRDSVTWDHPMKARKTASFGVSYDYSGMSYPETQMVEPLKSLCKKIEIELDFSPNNCLLNFYEDGDATMGFHSDSTKELADNTGVVIVSLGAERHISYKSKIDTEIIHKYSMREGMLLYMDHVVQDNWLHAIKKEKGAGQRISLTFRKII